jgi:TonB-dependent receptor
MTGTAKGVFVISFMLALGAVNAVMAGTIEGTIKDSKTGDPLVGANLRVVGTDFGATTDLDGKYVIGKVTPGIYSIRVFFTNYLQKVMAGVAVTGDESTTMNITLESTAGTGDAQHIDDTYVTADAVRTTNAALLTAQQRSSVIGNGISAEQIRLSPDANAGDALKRITGLSVVDDKFVFVRGVTDRYNSTTLNGVTVTGTDTDSDKKSFSFDLIPSSLISSTVVAKTATPDLPGDFSGGLVQVNTLDLPSRRLIAASVEGGNDNASSRKDFLKSPGGGSDWKAKDDGSRALPPDLKGVELAQALPNTWGTSTDQSRMNQSYSLALGDHFNLGGGELGFIASGTYKNNFKIEDYSQSPSAGGQPIFAFEGTRYREKYLWGGLGNVSWHPTENHRFSFENNFTRTAGDKVSQGKGLAESRDSTRTQTIQWDQRDIYLGQVNGQHTLPSVHGLDVKWRWAYSSSKAQEPDRKYAQYAKFSSGQYGLKENYRTWSELKEDTRGGQVDLEYPFGDGSIKAGYLQTERTRDFNIQAYFTDTSKLRGQNTNLIFLPIDEVFAPENYGVDANNKALLGFAPYGPFSGVYDGTQDLKAYYGMLDRPFRVSGRGFRFAGGVRVEDSDQVVSSPIAADNPEIRTSQINKKDTLPSANLTAEITATSNLRLGYYKSVNRPEFRELANVAYLDFDANQTVLGNPDLTRAVIKNYDVRVEWFPKAGEVLAASYFYKGLTDAIEEELLPSPDRYVRTWFNSPTGKNYGYELEARKDLGFAWKSLENLVVQANYTHVSSEVEYTESYNDSVTNLPVTVTKTRPLQGQAPYTMNAGLVYSIPDVGLSTSVLYNRIGKRLDAVGDTRDEDIYEQPRDLLDFALTQQFGTWMRLKFTIKDILAQDKVLIFGSTGSVWESVNAGTTYALSLSFNL